MNLELDKNWVIEVLKDLLSAAEDDCSQYGGDIEQDETVIKGRKLLEAIKNS